MTDLQKYEQFIQEAYYDRTETWVRDAIMLGKKFDLSPNVIKELYEIAQFLKAKDIVNTTLPKYEIYRRLIENYNKQIVINYRSSRVSIYNQFSTPLPIAYVLGQYVIGNRIPQNNDYFDSCAGNGLLTVAFPTICTTLNEFEPIRYTLLKEKLAGTWLKVINEDASNKLIGLEKLFNGIIINPPFHAPAKNKKSIELESFKVTDFDKIITYHTLNCMSDNGRAAIIIDGLPGSEIYPTTFWNERQYTKGNERGFWFHIYRNYNIEDLLYISGHKLLARQGQATNWRVLLINGRKQYDKKALPPLYNPNYDKLITDFDELWERVHKHLGHKESLPISKPIERDWLFIGDYPAMLIFCDKRIIDKKTKDYKVIAKIYKSNFSYEIFNEEIREIVLHEVELMKQKREKFNAEQKILKEKEKEYKRKLFFPEIPQLLLKELELIESNLGATDKEILFAKTKEKLSDKAINVLKQAKITDTEVILQSGTLQRKLYEEIKDTLERIGGKWKSAGKNPDGSPKGKIEFTRFNPQIIVNSILETGLKPSKNPTDYFPTPEGIVLDMTLGLRNSNDYFTKDVKILEPSAGTGGIADIIKKYVSNATLHCIEYLPVNAEILRQKGHNVVYEGDFLQYNGDSYRHIFMNPPFDGTKYIDHINHARTLLETGGDITAIVPITLGRSDKKTIDFWSMVASYGYIETEYTNQEFKESGTNVNTALIVINQEINHNIQRSFCLMVENNDYSFYKQLNDTIFPSINLAKIEKKDFSEFSLKIEKFVNEAIAHYQRKHQLLPYQPEYLQEIIEYFKNKFYEYLRYYKPYEYHELTTPKLLQKELELIENYEYEN